jgi:hypothetical protein
MESKPAASSAAFNETLQFITSVKLSELEKQRAAYNAHVKQIDTANALGRSSVARLEALLAAVRSAPSAGAASETLAVAGGLNLPNIARWIEQAKTDPSVSPAQISGWADALEQHLRRGTASFDYAKLFGELFTEWLQSADAGAPEPTVGVDDEASAGAGSEEDFQNVGRKELHEQRATFEARVFGDATKPDAERFRAYMEELFAGDRESSLTLKDVRKDMAAFAKELSSERLTTSSLADTIKDLLLQDLLSNEKRATLAEIARNDTILEEVASVLNMHLSRIGSWAWPQEGVPLEMRRALNGKYRFFYDPELLLALFVHHLGLVWGMKFKEQFKRFLTRSWKPSTSKLSVETIRRREMFLDEQPDEDTVATYRQNYQQKYAFLGQLPGDLSESTGYDEDGDVDPARATSAKQALLDHLNVDMLFSRTLHGTFTVLLSDFEWFGPSLDFDVVLATMQFFGVPDDWLAFFRTFLEAPLRFKDDPTESAPRKRQRGTPVGHALTTLFGEALMFVMDFAVNHRADGLFLYRIHDDLWLWDRDAARVVKGWKEMERFAAITGLRFNADKTGSATIGASALEGLPVGDVRWGFLRLDPAAARFVVDDAVVDTHINELQRQIGAAASVFGVVNRFNFYVRFIARNLGGRPAHGFGAAHVDAMIGTLARVQRSLFKGAAGGILDHLREMVAQRFGMTDLPLGWFFVPNTLGGLGLHNPLVELLALRQTIEADPAGRLKKVMDHEPDDLRRHQEKWDASTSERSHDSQGQRKPWNMTLDEYTSGREAGSPQWGELFNELTEYPEPYEMETTQDVNAATEVLRQWPGNATFTQYTDFESLGFYDRWIMALYCEYVFSSLFAWPNHLAN